MAPGELARMTGGEASATPEPDDEGRDLREEVMALARSLPGNLRRLSVRSGDRAIEVEWVAEDPADGPRRTTPAAPAGSPDPGPQEPTGPVADVPEDGTPVRAPLVGTFYEAPSPGADPFVRVGDEVEPGQTLGIVEAMKLMNPIVAEAAGVVTEVRVSDAESVEYDQVLMVLRPAGPAR